MIDHAQLVSSVVPESVNADRGPGRPAEQRGRILKILAELEADGLAIDASNEACRIVQEQFKLQHGKLTVPAKSTIRSAIIAWSEGVLHDD